MIRLRVLARIVFRRNIGSHRGELRIDGVPHEKVRAVLTEHGAEVIVPVVQPGIVAGQVPADTPGNAPVAHRSPEEWGESARELFVENEAVPGKRHIAVVGRIVRRHDRAVPLVRVEVRDLNCVSRSVEYPASRIGIAVVEPAFYFALGKVAPAVEFGLAVQLHAEVSEEFVVIENLGCAPDHGSGTPREPAVHHVLVARVNQGLRIVALDAAAGPV